MMVMVVMLIMWMEMMMMLHCCDGDGGHAWSRKIDDSGDGNGSDYDVDGFWLWDGWHNKGDIQVVPLDNWRHIHHMIFKRPRTVVYRCSPYDVQRCSP